MTLIYHLFILPLMNSNKFNLTPAVAWHKTKQNTTLCAKLRICWPPKWPCRCHQIIAFYVLRGWF